MTKRKILLGLIVFFVGVMITACGSKSNTNNTTTNYKDRNFDRCGSFCDDTDEGRFRVTDGLEFGRAVGIGTGFVGFNGEDPFHSGTSILDSVGGLADWLLRSLLITGVGAIHDAGQQVLVCGSDVLAYRAIEYLSDSQLEEFGCESTTIGAYRDNQFSAFGENELEGTYDADVSFFSDDNRVIDEVEIIIRDIEDNGRRTDITLLFDRRVSANNYESDDGRLLLKNRGLVLDVYSVRTGRAVGQYRYTD